MSETGETELLCLATSEGFRHWSDDDCERASETAIERLLASPSPDELIKRYNCDVFPLEAERIYRDARRR